MVPRQMMLLPSRQTTHARLLVARVLSGGRAGAPPDPRGRAGARVLSPDPQVPRCSSAAASSLFTCSPSPSPSFSSSHTLRVEVPLRPGIAAGGGGGARSSSSSCSASSFSRPPASSLTMKNADCANADHSCAFTAAPLQNADYDKDWFRAGRVGIILLSNDERAESELSRYFPPEIALHFTRLPGNTAVTVESLKANFGHLSDCAKRLTVSDLKVVCFACTSASFLIGSEKARAEILEGARSREMGGLPQPDVIPTTLTDCVIAALRAVLLRPPQLHDGTSQGAPSGSWVAGEEDSASSGRQQEGVRRIVVVTPYTADVNREQVAAFEAELPFLKIVAIHGFSIDTSPEMHRPSYATLKRTAKTLFANHNTEEEPVDGVFLSCSCVGGMGVIKDLEAELLEEVGREIPVVASNGAMLWHLARLAGYRGDMQDAVGMLGKMDNMYGEALPEGAVMCGGRGGERARAESR